MRRVTARAFNCRLAVIRRYLQRHSARARQENKSVYLPHNIAHLVKLIFPLLFLGFRACLPKGDIFFR